jgi:hypothetical protein
MEVDRFLESLAELALAPRTRYACAERVCAALEQAGFDTTGHPALAKDWGPMLARLGFAALTDVDYRPVRGDIVVFKPLIDAPNGHIQAFDGRRWISDHVQTEGFWPGVQYRKAMVRFMPHRLGQADQPTARWPCERQAARGPRMSPAAL